MDPRLERLQSAFLKALDASINSVGEADLQECFGDLKGQLGSNLQMAFVNMISKSEKRMENEFESITSRHKVHQHLPVASKLSSVADPRELAADSIKLSLDAQKAMRRAELEEMTIAIKMLDSENKKSGDVVGRLRTQLYNEIEALNEQSMKLERITEQCT